MLVANIEGKIVPIDPTNYARQGEMGWENCGPEDAVAIVINGELFALYADVPVTRDPIYDEDGNLLDAAPLAPVANIYDDGGQTTSGLLDSAATHTTQINDLETGLVDQTLTTEERIALIEQALCELALA